MATAKGTWCPPAFSAQQLTVGAEKVNTHNDNFFAQIRLAFNVSNECLAGKSFSFDDMEMPESKGGTKIGFTQRVEYLVKEIGTGDHDSLLSHAEAICTRVKTRDSFICPILAHFSRSDGTHYFLTMSCLPAGPHDFKVSQFDLKGNRDDRVELKDGEKIPAIHNRCFNVGKCWYGCDTKTCASLSTDERSAYWEGKLYAFSTPFPLTPKDRETTMQRLHDDVEVFDQIQTMDYSLLMTTIKTTKEEIIKQGGLPKAHLPNQPIICEDPEKPGQIIAYYLGIIDYLQEWTVGKKIAHLIKCCFAPHPISTVPPSYYRHQFYDHFDLKFQGNGIPVPAGSSQEKEKLKSNYEAKSATTSSTAIPEETKASESTDESSGTKVE